MSTVLSIDKNKVRQSFAAAVDSYDQLAGLQRKVGLQVLQQFSEQGAGGLVVDIGCGTGFLTRQLIDRHCVRQLFAVDIALSMVMRTRTKLGKVGNTRYICADAEFIPMKAYSVDTIISNLALQWCENLTTVFSGFRKLLKAEGVLVFSTFGPATLQELKRAWATVDDYTHVNDFYSANDLYGFLREAGFKDIQVTTQYYQSDYLTVIELMRELKGIGAHNVLTNRNRQMTNKASMQAMISTYEKNTVGGRGAISATYEIIIVTARVE